MSRGGCENTRMPRREGRQSAWARGLTCAHGDAIDGFKKPFRALRSCSRGRKVRGTVGRDDREPRERQCGEEEEVEDGEETEEQDSRSRRWPNHRGAVHISLSGDPRGNYLCRRALTLPLGSESGRGLRENRRGHRGAAAAIERDG